MPYIGENPICAVTDESPAQRLDRRVKERREHLQREIEEVEAVQNAAAWASTHSQGEIRSEIELLDGETIRRHEQIHARYMAESHQKDLLQQRADTLRLALEQEEMPDVTGLERDIQVS